jgi:hypothetical protein
MSDYAYWHAKLAGEDPDPPADRTQLPCGFWRLNGGDPLAVWIAGEERIALRGFAPGKLLSARYMEMIAEAGGFGKAVTEDAYRAAFAAGRWPDTDQVVAEQRNQTVADDAEALRDQISAATAGASQYGAIDGEEAAQRAQSLRARLLELAGDAKKRHEAEKAPHLEAGKAVDAKWLPMAKEAKAAADAIRAALQVFENAPAAPAVATAPTAPAPARKQIRGGYGRPAIVTAIKVATVADIDALFAAVRERPDVKAFLQSIAQKALDTNGEILPGVEVTEGRKVS